MSHACSALQGMVREQCKEGVRRLLMLTKAVFMRQVHQNRMLLWLLSYECHICLSQRHDHGSVCFCLLQVDENNWMPSDHQLTLVDKKFGGELTREDVLV